MYKLNINEGISLLIIIALGIAFVDSTARAENAPGVAYRTVMIEDVEIFPAAGAEPYKRDLKNLEYHLLDTGHFALETHGQEIADLMRDFRNRQLQSPVAAN